MKIDLDGKVALVTGGARGIGLGIARALASCGAAVAVNDVVADRAGSAVAALGGRAIAVPGDVSSEAEAERIVAEVGRALGPLDVLVNNAGIGGQTVRTLDQKTEVWDRVLAVDLRAPYLMAKAAGRIMCERKSGAIVNIASIAGMTAVPADNDYGVAKAGLIHLTKSLALDFARSGVRVNCIAPGLIETELAKEYVMSTSERKEAAVRTIPLRFCGQPEDIGNAVAFLVSDLARYVTGVCLPVDGGSSSGAVMMRAKK